MNKALPILLLVAMAVLGVVIKIALTPADDVEVFSNSGEPAVAGDLARRSSGFAGDRDDPSETIRTLTQLQQQTFERVEEERKQNKAMRESISDRIAEGVSETMKTEVGSLKEMFETESTEMRQMYETQIAELQAQVESAKAAAKDAMTKAEEVPSNQVALLDTNPSTVNDFGFDDLALNTTASASIRDNNSYTSLRPVTASGEQGLLNVVVDPLNGTSPINNAINMVNDSDALRSHPNQPGNDNVIRNVNNNRGSRSRGAGTTTQGEPMYTINDGATLFSNTTMTAMIGKVPIGNSVSDPFRFKIITGGENLAASKMRIAKPIENVIWTGYTTGNRELSCVSGYLDTVTLVYADGTISTTSTKSPGSRTTNETTYLGYISDRWGKPCIRGQLYDNGEAFLKNRAGLAGLAAGAEGISLAQTEIDETAEGRETTSITGDVGAFTAGRALSGAAQETLAYFTERTLGTFDIVYVPSGQHVTVHVETEIEFNYDPDGRRLSHVSIGNSNAYLD